MRWMASNWCVASKIHCNFRKSLSNTCHGQADVLRSSLVIFVTSTTGQGDMPKNTLKFWKNLRREKLNNTNCLRSLRFAIFGLGDSSYLKCEPYFLPHLICLLPCATLHQLEQPSSGFPETACSSLLTNPSLQIQLGGKEAASKAPATWGHRVLQAWGRRRAAR